jgi:hypothetical protein
MIAGHAPSGARLAIIIADAPNGRAKFGGFGSG